MHDTNVSASQPQPAAAFADWVTVWQSELAALAVDREVAEAAQRAVDAWAAAAIAASRHDPAGRSGPPPPPRPTTPLAPPDRPTEPAPPTGQPTIPSG